MKITQKRLRRAFRAGFAAARSVLERAYYEEQPVDSLSPTMQEAARRIRGDHPPAIIIHGVLPRSGTVYCGRLLRSHPDLHAYPNDIWEMPMLSAAPAVRALQESFIDGYRQNRTRFARNDFLALVGSAFIGYLYSQVPEGKRLLMKVPLAYHLAHFRHMFPHEECLMLMRDGRDLTASTLKTWPGRDFVEVVTDWRDAASHMLALDHPIRRYEEIVAHPEAEIRSICVQFDLNPERYPYDTIAAQPLKGSSEFVKEQGWRAVAQPQTFRSVGRWSDWTPRQKHKFKQIAGDVLIRAGYEKDDRW